MFNMLQKTKMFIYPVSFGDVEPLFQKKTLESVELTYFATVPVQPPLLWHEGGQGQAEPDDEVHGNADVPLQRMAHWSSKYGELIEIMTGWWLTYPPEKWWSESQLGWLFHSQYMESHKIPWFQSPPTRWGYHWFCGEKNLGWWSGRS